MQVRGQVRPERLLERRPARQRQRGHGRPVVRLRRGDDPPPLGRPPFDVVAPGQAQGRLVRLRPPGHQLHSGHLGGYHLDQPIGQPLLRFVGEVVVVHVGDPFGLLGGRGDQLGGSVAQARDHGTARARVQDPGPVGRPEPDALAPFDVGMLHVEEPVEDAAAVRTDRAHHRAGLSHARAPPSAPPPCRGTALPAAGRGARSPPPAAGSPPAAHPGRRLRRPARGGTCGPTRP